MFLWCLSHDLWGDRVSSSGRAVHSGSREVVTPQSSWKTMKAVVCLQSSRRLQLCGSCSPRDLPAHSSHRTAGGLEDGILQHYSVSIINVLDAGQTFPRRCLAQLTASSSVGLSFHGLPDVGDLVQGHVPSRSFPDCPWLGSLASVVLHSKTQAFLGVVRCFLTSLHSPARPVTSLPPWSGGDWPADNSSFSVLWNLLEPEKIHTILWLIFT